MKAKWAVAVFCLAAATPAAFAGTPSMCPRDAQHEGMHARMKIIGEQMDRIEVTTDREEQRKLMDLHIKHMREGMQEMRKREMGMACRVEMMSSMLEMMVRHEQAAQDQAGR